MLFTAGFLASLEEHSILSIEILALGCFVAATLGNMVGYEIGRRAGLKMFEKDGRFLKRHHLEMTQRFYARHGAMAIISARFMPIFRTLVPFLAGVAQVPYKKYMAYSMIGAFLWGVCLTVAGFFFGKILPPEQVDTYLLPIILLIIVVSFMPGAWHIWKEKRRAD